MKFFTFKKLNAAGLAHYIVPVIAIVVIGGIGSYLIKASHADSLTNAYTPTASVTLSCNGSTATVYATWADRDNPAGVSGHIQMTVNGKTTIGVSALKGATATVPNATSGTWTAMVEVNNVENASGKYKSDSIWSSQTYSYPPCRSANNLHDPTATVTVTCSGTTGVVIASWNDQDDPHPVSGHIQYTINHKLTVAPSGLDTSTVHIPNATSAWSAVIQVQNVENAKGGYKFDTIWSSASYPHAACGSTAGQGPSSGSVAASCTITGVPATASTISSIAAVAHVTNTGTANFVPNLSITAGAYGLGGGSGPITKLPTLAPGKTETATLTNINKTFNPSQGLTTAYWRVYNASPAFSCQASANYKQ